jgi:hypothetical protein
MKRVSIDTIKGFIGALLMIGCLAFPWLSVGATPATPPGMIPATNNTHYAGNSTKFLKAVYTMALTCVNNLTGTAAINGIDITGNTLVSNTTLSAPNATVTNASITSLASGVQSVSSNATISETAGDFIAVDTSGGNRTYSLPNAPVTGRRYIFVDSTSTWDSTHACAVNVVSGGNINGAASTSSTTANGTIRLVYMGSTAKWRTW